MRFARSGAIACYRARRWSVFSLGTIHNLAGLERGMGRAWGGTIEVETERAKARRIGKSGHDGFVFMCIGVDEHVDDVDALHGTYAGVACGYRSQLVKNSLNIRGMQLGCDAYAGAHKYLRPIEN